MHDFYRRPGVEVNLSIVHDPSAWPAHLLESNLLHNLTSATLATSSQPSLEVEDIVRAVQQQTEFERRSPHLGMGHHRHIFATFGDVLSSALSGTVNHCDVLYAKAICPCRSGISSAKLMQHHGRATALVTYQLDLLADVPSVETPRAAPGDAHRQDTHSDGHRMPKNIIDCTGSDSIADVTVFHKNHPLQNAHLLPSQNGAGPVPVALLCIASHDEIYSLMASALMQRRVFGISHPILGLTFSPTKWIMHIAFGWIGPAMGSDCVELHVAHAPLDSGPNSSLGVFDISEPSITRTLACALSLCSKELVSVIADVQPRVASVRQTLMRQQYATWRVDLVRGALADQRGIDEASGWIRKGLDKHSTCSSVTPTSSVLPSSHVDEEERSLLRGLPLHHLDLRLADCYKHRDEHLGLALADYELRSRRGMPSQTRERASFHETLIENVSDMFQALLEGLIWPTGPAGTAYEETSENSTGREKDFLIRFPRNSACEHSTGIALGLAGLSASRDSSTSGSAQALVHDKASTLNDVACARAPWLSLVAARFDDVPPADWHISSGHGVPHARNVHFDGIATDDELGRWNAITELDKIAEICTTFDWASEKKKLVQGLPPDPWIDDYAAKMAKLVAKKCVLRGDQSLFWINRARNDYSCHTHARVLSAPQLSACDTVAFTSVAGVFDVPSTGDPSTWQQVQDFRVLGKPQPYDTTPCDEAEDEDVEGEICLPHIPEEVRRRLGIVGKPFSSRLSSSPLVARLIPPSLSRSPRDVLDSAPNSICSSSGHDKLELPIIWFEDRAFHGTLTRAYDFARLRLVSTTRFYAAIGIYDLVVFALVSSGRNGILLCAWGSKPSETTEHTDVITNIADTNCPRWDIGVPSQALRFDAFISRLREVHTPRVLEAFERRRQEFVQAWKTNPDSPRFRWTMKHQQEEPIVQALPAQLRAEQEELPKWEARIDLIEALIGERLHEREQAALTPHS